MRQAFCPSLIGRQDEQRALEAGLDAARRRQGQAYVLSGEAGIGKTRLAAEIRQRAVKSGMLCLWGSCPQAELSLPYLPFLGALGAYLAAAERSELTQRLGPLAAGLGHLFPQLHSGATEESGGDARDRKLRLFEAIVALVSLSAERQGTLFVIEDLQWADTSTRELVDYMVRRVPRTCIMLLVTYRSDELHRRHPLTPLIDEWRRDADTTIVDLLPLPPIDVAGMIQAIFRTASVRDDFRDLVHTHSSGNPFVIEEILKDAIDRGDIFRTATGWELKPIAQLRLPQRVRDAILARLEKLPAVQLQLLRAAAVLNRPCDFDLIARFVGKPTSSVEAALSDCVQHQLLARSPGPGDRYEFRHALTREAIYDELVPTERRRLHARAAEVLDPQNGSNAAEVCHHLFAADEWVAAMPLALEVAERAAATLAHEEAAALYELMLPHVTNPGMRADILLLLWQTLNDLYEFARAARYLEGEIPLLERAGEMGAAARLRLGLARAYGSIGRRDLCRVELERGLQYLETRGPSGDMAEAYKQLAQLDLMDFRNREGVDAATRAVAIAMEVDDRTRLIEGYHYLGANLIFADKPDEGFAVLDRAIAEALEQRRFRVAAEAIGNEIEGLLWDFRFKDAVRRMDLWRSSVPEATRPTAVLRAGILAWRHGALEQAVACYREGVARHVQRGSRKEAAEAELYLAVALAELGRLEESRSIVARAPIFTKEQRVLEAWIWMRMGLDSAELGRALAETRVVEEATEWPQRQRRWLAEIAVEVLLAAGKPEHAREVSVAIHPEPPDPYQMRMEGRLALATGDDPLARERLSAAADVWNKIGGRLEEARARRLLGEAEARMGQHDCAVEEFRRSHILARECGAATEERRSEEQLTRLGLPTRPTAADVKAALEMLQDPAALKASTLAGVAVKSSELRDVLVAAVSELARGPAGPEAESGRVLLDYYVKRVGSQDVVAERLHLSRRTFYRRLHRGLQILADELGARHVAGAVH